MILRDFQCEGCQYIFEELTSEQELSCPKCTGKCIPIICSPYVVRDGTLFARRRIPLDFKEGVLDRIKSKYPSAKDNFRT